ncbi:MAG: M20/M25/M40 family metallo-hydrolase [Acidobacteriaceae bacterium]|nr:M20/M25/M40 family metallo-hydrolase [Acidobacteriaceae bacterium]
MKIVAAGVALGLVWTVGMSAQSDRNAGNAEVAEARAIFKQLIEINTTDSVGSVTAAAEAMRQRLLDAGFPAADLKLLGPNDRKMNLVARYRGKQGSTLKPMLVICHLDVVEANRSDWTTDPFVFTEKDGYFYGRGTYDVKDGDAAAIEAFLRMKRDGFVPSRDIILALTADEEGGASNGVGWLMQHHPEEMQAEFVINPDGGGMTTVNGKPYSLNVEATEKTYADYVLTATSPGGHSSEPMPGNAIYRLVAALAKVEKYQFPFELNEVTRAQFAALAKLDGGRPGADRMAVLKTPPDPSALKRLNENPEIYPALHTTCVATMIQGGHAPNALPNKVQANVNCRILPGHTQEQVREELVRVIGDTEVKVAYKSDGGRVTDTAPNRASAAPPPPLPAVFDPLKQVVEQMWPELVIVPSMEFGATDSIYTMAAGMPSYGISGMGMDRDENRAHGKDERIKVPDFDAGCEFFYRYLKAVAK